MVWVREWRILEDFSFGSIPLNIINNININDKGMLYKLVFSKGERVQDSFFRKRNKYLSISGCLIKPGFMIIKSD